jgi:hypothetical protein
MTLTTDNRDAAYEELRDRGVVFVEESEEGRNGIGPSFLDPSGNQIRLTPGPEDGARPRRRRRFRRREI